MNLNFTYGEDADGNPLTLSLPAKWGICENCKGDGTHLCEGMRHHAYTEEEFEDFSEEEQEAYFTRGGMYDVTCETCKGTGKVVVPDRDRAKPEDLKVYDEEMAERARQKAEDAHTFRMETGGY